MSSTGLEMRQHRYRPGLCNGPTGELTVLQTPPPKINSSYGLVHCVGRARCMSRDTTTVGSYVFALFVRLCVRACVRAQLASLSDRQLVNYTERKRAESYNK